MSKREDAETVSLRGAANLALNALHECTVPKGAEKQVSDAMRALETSLAEQCSLEVGDGAGSLFIYGSQEATLRVQDIILEYVRLRRQINAQHSPAPTEDQILAITTAYEQGVGKGRDDFNEGTKTLNPYSNSWNCDYAWSLGYREGKKQAVRMVANGVQGETK